MFEEVDCILRNWDVSGYCLDVFLIYYFYYKVLDWIGLIFLDCFDLFYVVVEVSCVFKC